MQVLLQDRCDPVCEPGCGQKQGGPPLEVRSTLAKKVHPDTAVDLQRIGSNHLLSKAKNKRSENEVLPCRDRKLHTNSLACLAKLVVNTA